MKTKKFLSITMMLAIVLGTVFTFSSCSKDDKDKTDDLQLKLVGKWKTSWDDENEEDYGLLTFKSDGSGTYLDHDDDHATIESFYWTYEDAKSILTLMWLENGKVVDKEVAHLTWISDKAFFADELVEDNRIWEKQ